MCENGVFAWWVMRLCKEGKHMSPSKLTMTICTFWAACGGRYSLIRAHLADLGARQRPQTAGKVSVCAPRGKAESSAAMYSA